MTQEKLIQELNSGKIFTAKFIKKDGSLRTMNCRMNVKKHTKGVGLSFNPFEKGLLPVFDLQKEAYRFINLNTLQSVKFGGEEYRFNHSS